jgi:uncharacterized spore protein YtfJ
MAQTVVDIATTLARIGVKAAFGEPVEIDGATAVPIALTAFAFGGGSGRLFPVASHGGAGLGGMVAIPVGILATRDGAVRFSPNPIAMLALSVPLTCAAGVATALIARAARRRPPADDESTLERAKRRFIG